MVQLRELRDGQLSSFRLIADTRDYFAFSPGLLSMLADYLM